MYSDIVDSFKDRLIGDAVDNIVDSGVNNLKCKNTLANTYVWTCINKETHNGSIANLTFINKLGKRQRIPYDGVAHFCQNNYVSNIIVEDGKVKMQGCSLYDIPNFKLNMYGQYDLHAPHDENWVYNKAFPYIQSQERLIQEDFRNNTLKGSNGSGVKTNATANIKAITGGISNVRGTAEAVAITAVTAAGAAAVAGTVVAGKAIFKQINKKKLIEEQDKICEMLNKTSNFIRILTIAKHKTNAMYRNNKDLITYNNNVDANNETTGKLTNEIRSLGMKGCIQKVSGAVNSAKARATSNKIMDMKLNNANIGFGTLDAYIKNIEDSLNELIRLHNETKILLNNNIIQKEEANRFRIEQEQIETRQRELVSGLEFGINNYKTVIDDLKSRELNKDTAHIILSEYNRCNKDNLINKLIERINLITNIEERQRLNSLVLQISKDADDLSSKINNLIRIKETEAENEVTLKLNEAQSIIDSLINDTYTVSEKTDKINSYRKHINEAMEALLRLSNTSRLRLDIRLKEIETKMDKSSRSIDERTKENEKQLIKYNAFLDKIKSKRDELERARSSNDIKNIIDSFNNSASSVVAYDIKSITLLEQVQQIIEDTRTEFNNKYEVKIEEEKQYEINECNKIDNIIQQILDKKTWLEKFSVDIVNEQTLKDIEIQSLEEYREGLDTEKYKGNLYNKYVKIREKYNELELTYRRKKSAYQDIINSENSAIMSFKNDINSIYSKIRRLEKEYEKKYIVNNIEDLKTSVNKEKLQSTEWLDNEIDLISQEYKRKCLELGI